MPSEQGFWQFLGAGAKKLDKKNKQGFSLTEVLISLAVVAIIIVLVIPVITTRAHNKSYAVSYESEVKQMLNSFLSLPTNENKADITHTMMFVENDDGDYTNNSGLFINKYMKVVKYCGNSPGDCFGSEYFTYKNHERQSFDISVIKGACAQLKNGVSICLKPQIRQDGNKDEIIQGWLDLNGPSGPNVYGRDLRAFSINVKKQAIFPEDGVGEVILPNVLVPCENPEKCNRPEIDPCEYNPAGPECCKREGYVPADALDPCCPWFVDKENYPKNYNICYGGPNSNPPCDPETDPDCPTKCLEHTITGPNDECCAILANNDPPIRMKECCTSDSTDAFCTEQKCLKNPEGSKECCLWGISNGSVSASPESKCCKIKDVHDAVASCQTDCDKDSNSEKCCESTARRELIIEPGDACCAFTGVNGVGDPKAAQNSYNQYCCRLPKNDSTQCCRWKSEHLDYYASYNPSNDTTDGLDSCCHHDQYGIKSGNTDILIRCCRPDEEAATDEENDKCCHYLVEQMGDDELKVGKSLRRCCKYTEHMHKAQCCSDSTDGIYVGDSSYSSQCCMPNSIYDKNVTPDIRCCFASDARIEGELDNIWQNKRHTDCCSYGDQTYGSGKANDQGIWQLNCCHLGRVKYPEGAEGLEKYNDNCCGLKSGKRNIWNRLNNNECCETLLEQSPGYVSDDKWKNQCCKGYLDDAEHKTNHEYYKTEPNCCYMDKNWVSECCSIKGIDKSTDKWKKNCCSMPNSYESKAQYRANCCESSSKDYTRKDYGADNPKDSNDNALNAVNVDLTSNKKYCCHPDAADPDIECCKLFKSLGNAEEDVWRDWDADKGSAPISDAYKQACCEKSTADSNYCPNSCAIRWETTKELNYDFANCCTDRALAKNRNKVNRETEVWQNNCCAYALVNKKNNNTSGYASYADYRKGCCDSTKDGTFKEGGGANQEATNCCIPNAANPTKECCAVFKHYDTEHNGSWKGHDGETITEAYKIACCKLGECPYNDDPDSCKIRSKANNSAQFDLPNCCGDATMQSEHNKEEVWQSVCCKYRENYPSNSDYRKYCCSGDGVNKTDLNPASQNNQKYCCDPSAENPTEACCGAFKENGNSTDAWVGFGGETISDNYKIACCKKNVNVCPDSCNLRSKTNDSTKYNLPTCCTDATMKSEHRTEAAWKQACCDYPSDYDSYTSYKDGISGCCSLSQDETRAGSGDLSKNKEFCCLANAVTATISQDGESINLSGVIPTKACCERFKANGWKDHAGTPLDRSYKLACATINPDVSPEDLTCLEKWALGGAYRTDSLPACCEAVNGKVSSSVWSNACCSGANKQTAIPGYGISAENFASYCCSPKSGNEEGSVLNDTKKNKYLCCSKYTLGKACCGNQGFHWDNTTPDVSCCNVSKGASATKYCCDYEKDTKGANGTWTSEEFHKACGDDVNPEYYSCKMRMNEGLELNVAVGGVNCCDNLKEDASNRSNANFRKYCCGKYANKPSDLTDFSANCCNPQSGNDDATIIGTELKNPAACCNKYTLGKACCGNQGFRWDNTTPEQTCCNVSKGASATKYCCDYEKDTKGVNGTWTSEDFHKACGDDVNPEYYSCKMRMNEGLELNVAVGGVNCCEELVKDSSNFSNDNFQKRCCGKYAKNPFTNYNQYCCSPTTNNDTGSIKNSTEVNLGVCCSKYTLGKACCGKQGFRWDDKTAEASCCDVSKNGEATDTCCGSQYNTYGANGTWTSEEFHDACGGINPSYYSCVMRMNHDLDLNVTVGGINCCDNLKSYASNAIFQKYCCNKYADNPSQLTGFSQYCCNPATNNDTGAIKHSTKVNLGACCSKYTAGKACCKATENAKTHGKQWDQADGDNTTGNAGCCDYNNGVENKYCCEKASENWNSRGGNTFRSKCCKNVDKKYCDCTRKDDISNSNWQNQCCTAENVTNLGLSTSEITSYCCSGSNSTSLKVSGSNDACCRTAGSTCCPIHQTDELCNTCALRAEYRHNLYNTSSCCYNSTVYSKLAGDSTLRSAWKTGCCKNSTVKGTTYYKQYCCMDGNVGKATNGSSQWDDKENCCAISGSSVPATTNCCDYASSLYGGLNGTWIDEDFHKRCGGDVDSKYYSCQMRMDAGLDLNVTVGSVNCCESLGKTSTNHSVANFKKYCCSAAKNSNWTYSSINSSTMANYRLECCKSDEVYCNCEQLYSVKKKMSSASYTKETCCGELKSAHSNDKGLWARTCCKEYISNPFTGYSGVCCTSSTSGIIYSYDASEDLSGSKSYQCCNVQSEANDTCCGLEWTKSNKWLGTKCCKGKDAANNGYDYNGSINRARCCDYTGEVSYTNSNCCSEAKKNTNQFDENNANYANYGGKNFETKCCSNFRTNSFCDCKHEYLKDIQKWQTKCCKVGGTSPNCCDFGTGFEQYCTCAQKATKNYDLGNCCTYENDGSLSGDTWKNKCCTFDNLNSAPDENARVGCCDLLYQKNPNNSVFQQGGTCCTYTIDSSHPYGKYDSCRHDCDPEKGNVKENQVYYNSKAAACCDSGYYDTDEEWATYCCLLKKNSTEDEFKYSVSNKNIADICCPYRRMPTGIYYYVPSYVNSSQACSGGGLERDSAGNITKTICSAYYDASKGFYCSNQTMCQYMFDKPQMALNGAFTDDDIYECCNQMKHSTPENFGLVCCAAGQFYNENKGPNGICSGTCKAWFNGATDKLLSNDEKLSCCQDFYSVKDDYHNYRAFCCGSLYNNRDNYADYSDYCCYTLFDNRTSYTNYNATCCDALYTTLKDDSSYKSYCCGGYQQFANRHNGSFGSVDSYCGIDDAGWGVQRCTDSEQVAKDQKVCTDAGCTVKPHEPNTHSCATCECTCSKGILTIGSDRIKNCIEGSQPNYEFYWDLKTCECKSIYVGPSTPEESDVSEEESGDGYTCDYSPAGGYCNCYNSSGGMVSCNFCGLGPWKANLSEATYLCKCHSSCRNYRSY